MPKAISLISGGLDSLLATKLIQQQGIQVKGIYFSTVFFQKDQEKKIRETKAQVRDFLGIDLNVYDLSDDLLALVRNPRYGHGRNLNPCLDCHIAMIKKAGEYMEECGAEFLITGEVLGERPMSQQRRHLELIDNKTQLGGLIVRPLSAQVLPITVPEQKGIIKREKLLGIFGRSRKMQLALAKELGLSQFPWPAGGCLLTEPEFAKKLKDLFVTKEEISMDEIALLKVGRHFKINSFFKLIVGKNDEENKYLLSYAMPHTHLFFPENKRGPLGIFSHGTIEESIVHLCARIIARYSDKENTHDLVSICYQKKSEEKPVFLRVNALDNELLEQMRI